MEKTFLYINVRLFRFHDSVLGPFNIVMTRYISCQTCSTFNILSRELINSEYSPSTRLLNVRNLVLFNACLCLVVDSSNQVGDLWAIFLMCRAVAEWFCSHIFMSFSFSPSSLHGRFRHGLLCVAGTRKKITHNAKVIWVNWNQFSTLNLCCYFTWNLKVPRPR